MFRTTATLVLALLSLPALADNLATEWIDRVRNEVEQEAGPLSDRPVDYKVYGGVYGYYTDNLYLTNNSDANGDSAVTGFARGTVEYSDARVELSADLLVNFDYFMETHVAREDEERFYGKARYTDGVFDLQLVEIVRREFDPLDTDFTERARRMVTNTLPRAGVKVAQLVSVELFGQIETVRFEHNELDGRENENYRAGLAVLADVTENLHVGAEGGYLRIHYRRRDITPGADGYFARAAARGEPFPGLLLNVGLGWSRIHSFRREAGDDHYQSNSTLDADVQVRYEATETLTIFADYVRRFGFSGFGNTYRRIDRGILIVEWQAVEKLLLRVRGQYDYVAPSESFTYSYWSGSLGARYRIIEHLSVDGGVIYRGGNRKKVADDDWDNWIFYLGAIVDF